MSRYRGRIAFESAFHLPRGLSAEWAFPGPRGKANLHIFSVFEDCGVGDPVPTRIVMDFQLDAPSLDDASKDALQVSYFIVPALSLAANATYLDPQIVTVYHADDERDTHELKANFVFSQESPVLTGSRELDALAAQSIVQSLMDMGDRGVQLHRAMVHYNEALFHWRPEATLKSVEWLFVALENMAPLAYEVHQAETGLSDDKLAAAWAANISPRRCPRCSHSWVPRGSVISAARTALLLEGDTELFKKAPR